VRAGWGRLGYRAWRSGCRACSVCVWVWYLRVCVRVRTWVCAHASVRARACERVRECLCVCGCARTRVCACARVLACCVWEVCERVGADRQHQMRSGDCACHDRLSSTCKESSRVCSMHGIAVKVALCWRRSRVVGLFAARIRSACVSFGAHELFRGARRCVGVCDHALWWSSYILRNKTQLALAQSEKASSFSPCAGSR